MVEAIEEAKISLQEKNHGFGAVIVKNGELIAKAHDTERTTGDSTAHAEMTVIRSASSKFGKDLSGCVMIATHEPFGSLDITRCSHIAYLVSHHLQHRLDRHDLQTLFICVG